MGILLQVNSGVLGLSVFGFCYLNIRKVLWIAENLITPLAG